MNKIIKMILVCLVLLLFVPGIVSAAQQDLSISYLVLLEDKTITKVLDGNVTVVLGNVEVQSDIKGSLIVVFGKASVNSNISGDVVSVFGDVDIHKGSRIMGNLVSVGKVQEAENVVISGSKFVFNVDIISLFKTNGILINASILYALIALASGLIMITVFSQRYRVMSYSLGNRVMRRMVLGGLAIISFTILLVFLIFFFVAPIMYILILMLANIVASIYVGTLIFKRNNERSTIYLEFFVGHILISILKIVPLIFLPVGSYIALMVYGICYVIFELSIASWGVGTIIDTGFGKKS